MTRLVIVLLLATGCHSRAVRYGALAGTSTALIAADWVQTTTIVADCDEKNPFIGRCGERIPPDVWFPLMMAGNLAAGLLLGDVFGQGWFGAVTGGQAATVIHNALTP